MVDGQVPLCSCTPVPHFKPCPPIILKSHLHSDHALITSLDHSFETSHKKISHIINVTITLLWKQVFSILDSYKLWKKSWEFLFLSQTLPAGGIHHPIGQTQLIYCFSDLPVHWSLKQVRKHLGNRKCYFLNRYFFWKISIFVQFFPGFSFLILFLFFSALWNGSGKYPRSNKAIKSGLTENVKRRLAWLYVQNIITFHLGIHFIFEANEPLIYIPRLSNVCVCKL